MKPCAAGLFFRAIRCKMKTCFVEEISVKEESYEKQCKKEKTRIRNDKKACGDFTSHSNSQIKSHHYTF